jgi:hypothetical protein
MMEAASTSKTTVNSTRLHQSYNTEDSNHQTHCYEALKCYSVKYTILLSIMINYICITCELKKEWQGEDAS